MITNSRLQTLGFVLAVNPTAVVARAVVLSIFVNKVLRANAFRIVTEMRSVKLLTLKFKDLEKSACNCSRVLVMLDVVLLEETGEVEDNAIVVFCINAKKRSVTSQLGLPTTFVEVDGRVLEEVLLKFLGEIKPLIVVKILKRHFVGMVEVNSLKESCLAHFCMKKKV